MSPPVSTTELNGALRAWGVAERRLSDSINARRWSAKTQHAAHSARLRVWCAGRLLLADQAERLGADNHLELTDCDPAVRALLSAPTIA